MENTQNGTEIVIDSGRCEWCQRGKLLFCPNQIVTGINIAGSHAEDVYRAWGIHDPDTILLLSAVTTTA